MVDDDGSGSYDTIGEIQTSMGALMGAKAQTYTQPLEYQGAKNRGSIIVRAQAVASSNRNAEFTFKW